VGTGERVGVGEVVGVGKGIGIGIGVGNGVGVGVGDMPPETFRLPLAHPVRNMKTIQLKAKETKNNSLLVLLFMAPIPYR